MSIATCLVLEKVAISTMGDTCYNTRMKPHPQKGIKKGLSTFFAVLLAGSCLFAEEMKQVSLPKADIVIEPENFQFMTYGWQIGESDDASGGAYIHMKEGVGDFESEDLIEADPSVRAGDFYNVTGDRRRMEARCYFDAPRPGMYHVAVRTMAHLHQCSNITFVRFNKGQRLKVGDNGTKPFVWLWHRVGRVHLKKGLNYASFMAHQDDVKVDQMIVSESPLKMLPGFSGTFKGARPAPTLQAEIHQLNMSLTADTLAIKQDRIPRVSIYIHKNVPAEINARLMLSVEDSRLRSRTMNEVRLGESKELVRFPWKFELPVPLEKREYLLRCALLVGSKVVEERNVVLSRSYDWFVLGPLPYMEVDAKGSVETDSRIRNEYRFDGRPFRWQTYSEKHTDPFCLMDFKKMFSEKHQWPPKHAALYAYTEVDAAESGSYLLKAQGDDNLIVWVNGKKAVAMKDKGPPIRTAREVEITLSKGRNLILLRLNQKEAQWQAGIRIRAAGDGVANVKGIPFADQDIDLE